MSVCMVGWILTAALVHLDQSTCPTSTLCLALRAISRNGDDYDKCHLLSFDVKS